MKVSHQLEHVLEDKLLGGWGVKLFRIFLHRGHSVTERPVKICVPYGFLSLEIIAFLDFKNHICLQVLLYLPGMTLQISTNFKMQDRSLMAHHNRVREAPLQ